MGSAFLAVGHPSAWQLLGLGEASAGELVSGGARLLVFYILFISGRSASTDLILHLEKERRNECLHVRYFYK